ncbi:MAG: hypothetical protein IH602_12590 [Bryobacteraceae bacterium]|nr:hypothetical protein [Bryobacteraceae bacterium]
MTLTTLAAIFTTALWAARAASLALALLWGAFFVAHIKEWFIDPKGVWPPPSVWFFQALHGLMIAGFLVALKWDRIGMALMLAASVVFFGLIGMNRFPWFALVNLIPVALFAAYWALSRRTA